MLVAAAALLTASTGVAADPSEARLTINDEVYNVPLGKAFAVRVGGERLTMRIDPQTVRSFEIAGVAFRYPTALEPSESDGGEGIRVWTFQGASAAVMLQRYDGGIDTKSLRDVLVDNLIEREGGGDVERQAVKLTGADRAYQGVQLKTKKPATGGVPATQSVQNLFTFANPDGVFALIVQDVHADGADDSAEYQETLRLLGESLTTGPEAPAERP